MNKVRKLANNAYIFSIIAKGFSVLVGIIYSIFYSRYLGAELRGTASVVNNYADIISIFLCLGAFQAYPYFKQLGKKDIFNQFINNVITLMFLYYLVIIPIIIDPSLGLTIRAAMALSPIWMCSRQLNYVVLVEKPKLSNIANMILDAFDLIFILILFFFTTSNIVWCLAIVSVKQIVCLMICLKNVYSMNWRYKPTLRGFAPYIRYGIVPMITIILMEINYKVDVLMLEWFGIQTAAIGVYSLGVMLAQKVWMIPDALKDILLSKLVAGKNEDEVAKVCRLSFFVTMICEAAIVVFGKILIRLLYGAEYEDAYGITLIICAGVIGMVFYKMIYSYNVANGHKNVNFILLVFSALVNVVLNAIFIPLYGSYGAAIASLGSYFLCGASFLVFFVKKTNYKVLDVLLIKTDDIRYLLNMIRK